MKKRVRLQGEHLTHRPLWHTAQRFLAAGLAEEKGSFYPLLASVVFGYFSFEAYLNTALREVDPATWKIERKFFSTGTYQGTIGKYKYLAELANLTIDASRRPFQTVKKVSEARDFLAHAKVEEFDLIVPAETLDEFKPHPSALDKYSSAPFAKAALQDIERVADALHLALLKKFVNLQFGSKAGAFSGVTGGFHASLIVEPSRSPSAGSRGSRKVTPKRRPTAK